ncbi:uncharacterized protein LOC100205244 isoform X1 [Hydra vulgaris]|uniref:uncharacterized protein LOC100205244 isoform X1 n=1 Tax=Hydra vulgaris TaxID=6087 RepID=UPI001F5E564C|nr:uncharacterized protein LOC100205244 isoform X1 [Hydra vulgaris]
MSQDESKNKKVPPPVATKPCISPSFKKILCKKDEPAKENDNSNCSFLKNRSLDKNREILNAGNNLPDKENIILDIEGKAKDNIQHQSNIFHKKPRKTCFSPDNPKEEITFSLTEVSSIRQNGLDDTLDFSSSEDNILLCKNAENIKNDFSDLPIPPPLIIESDEESQLNCVNSTPTAGPIEDLASQFDFLIKPPPSPDIDTSESEESCSDDLPLDVLNRNDNEDEDSFNFKSNDDNYQNKINFSENFNLKNISEDCEQNKRDKKMKKELIDKTISSTQYDSKKVNLLHNNLSKCEKLEELFPVVEVDSGRGLSPEYLNAKIINSSAKNKSSDNCFSSIFEPISSQPSNESWSSSSLSSDSDNELELISKPKVNIREKLLKHMKNMESVSDAESFFSSKRVELEEDCSILSDDEAENCLNDIDVCDWTTSDVCDWLELIGLVHLKNVFRDHGVNGKMLFDINLHLLDSMDINSDEDRELILSEIYALQNPSDADLQVSILDALDKATGDDRQKMLSLIQALQTPSAEAYTSSFPSQLSKESPLFNPNFQASNNLVSESNCLVPTKNAIDMSVTSGVTGVKDTGVENFDNQKVFRGECLTSQSDLNEMQKKKKKRKGFFSSFLWKREKKPKSAIVEASLSMLVQASPQGMIKIFYQSSNNKVHVNLLISFNTLSCEVCKMSLEALDLIEDFKTFYIAVCRMDGKGENLTLRSDECPLMIQCKWEDMKTYQFELKQNIDGYVTVNKEDLDLQEMVTVRLGISFSTTSSDLIPVLIKKFKEKSMPSSYKLQLFNEGNVVADSIFLLSLPLYGHKFHTFKFVNISDESKQKELKQTELNEFRAKTVSLEKRMLTIATTNADLNTANSRLSSLNQELQTKVDRFQEEIHLKTIEIKKLQDKISEKASQQFISDTNDYHSLKQKIHEQQVHLEHTEERNRTLKEGKEMLENDLFKLQEKFNLIELSNCELSKRCKELEQAKKYQKEADYNIEKLVAENKEHQKTIKVLEEKLAEAEYKYSQYLLTQNDKSMEFEDIVSQNEVLEHSNIEKDSKILELEYSIQKKEREFREIEDQLEDESRKRKRDIEQKDDLEKTKNELLIKVDELKKQLSDKEKSIQSMKSQIIKQEKKIKKQKSMSVMESSGKDDLFQEIKRQHQQDLLALETKVECLQKQLVEKALSNKKYEFACSKEKEDMDVLIKDLERKLSAKDAIIERLETKIAKHDMTVVSKIQDQTELMKTKEERIHILELEYARMEKEYTGSLRESANNIRTKDIIIQKLETKIKKLEQSNRENGLKIEKYFADKKNLLQQVTADHEKDIRDWKNRQREWEEKLTEKEENIKEITKKQSEMQVFFENRAKKREKEFKRQKYLLEQILEMINLRAPSLLRDLQNITFQDRKKSLLNEVGNKQASLSTNDDWC